MAVESYEAPPPRRGMSLAKGPVAIIGIASVALGVLGLIFASTDFTMHPPSGTVNGGTFIGIEGNGWTWVGFAAGGLLLLLGSPLHWGAKSMAFVVGIAYGVGALIALSDGTDILGIFATNAWTKLILGVAGVALVILSTLPRVGGRTVVEEPAGAETRGRFRRRRAVEREEPVPAGTATTTHATPNGTLDDRV
jgi:hypothetical protein